MSSPRQTRASKQNPPSKGSRKSVSGSGTSKGSGGSHPHRGKETPESIGRKSSSGEKSTPSSSNNGKDSDNNDCGGMFGHDDSRKHGSSSSGKTRKSKLSTSSSSTPRSSGHRGEGSEKDSVEGSSSSSPRKGFFDRSSTRGISPGSHHKDDSNGEKEEGRSSKGSRKSSKSSKQSRGRGDTDSGKETPDITGKEDSLDSSAKALAEATARELAEETSSKTSGKRSSPSDLDSFKDESNDSFSCQDDQRKQRTRKSRFSKQHKIKESDEAAVKRALMEKLSPPDIPVVKEIYNNGTIIWNEETEAILFQNVLRLKPVGPMKHWKMLLIRKRVSAALHYPVSSDAIWNHLGTLFDMKSLDEEESETSHAVEVFSLPKSFQSLKKIKLSDS